MFVAQNQVHRAEAEQEGLPSFCRPVDLSHSGHKTVTFIRDTPAPVHNAMYHWQLNRERGTVPRAVGNTDIVYRMVYGSFNRRMAPRHRRNENDDFEDDSINGLAFSADG